MEKIPKFNKLRAFNKAVGPEKKSKINKHRAYVYSGLKSNHYCLATLPCLMGSYDLNLFPKIAILVGDIRSRSCPNIGGTYGTYSKYKRNAHIP